MGRVDRAVGLGVGGERAGHEDPDTDPVEPPWQPADARPGCGDDQHRVSAGADTDPHAADAVDGEDAIDMCVHGGLGLGEARRVARPLGQCR